MTVSAFEQALQGLDLFKDTSTDIVPMNPTQYMIEVGASAGKIQRKTAEKLFKIMVETSLFSTESRGFNHDMFREIGLVAVPYEPNEHMVKSGGQLCGLDGSVVVRVYSAMMKASIFEPPVD